MSNIKFSESTQIHCAPEFAFDYTQDYRNRLQWDTFLVKADQTEVTFTYSFRLRFPFSLTGRFVKNNLQQNVKQRLTNLKMNIEQITWEDQTNSG